MTWSGPLDESAPHLMAALQQLLDCPEVFRPFVILRDLSTNLFVQFAGSTERGLLFDVPALGIVTLQIPTVAEAVNDALAAMRAQGVPGQGIVQVTFESTRNAPGKNPAKA
jgi:hypothetical protein